MSQALPCPSVPTSNTTLLTPTEREAVRLYREEGLSKENVRKATGLPNHRIRTLLKDLPRGLKTPFSKSVARVYELAIRPQGIKDYELREILHEEYGCTWDEQKGRYQAKYTDDTIKQVKEKVRDRAGQESQFAIFVMDWVCDHSPTDSRVFLEKAALNLMACIDECVNEFMECFATCGLEDSDTADLAHRKQVYAARRHILKLVSGMGASQWDSFWGEQQQSPTCWTEWTISPHRQSLVENLPPQFQSLRTVTRSLIMSRLRAGVESSVRNAPTIYSGSDTGRRASALSRIAPHAEHDELSLGANAHTNLTGYRRTSEISKHQTRTLFSS